MYLIAIDHSSYMTVLLSLRWIYWQKGGRDTGWEESVNSQCEWARDKAEKSKLQTVVLTDTVARVKTKATERSVWSGLFQVSCLLPPQTDRHSCQTKIPLPGLNQPQRWEDTQADLGKSPLWSMPPQHFHSQTPRLPQLPLPPNPHTPAPSWYSPTVPGRPVYLWRAGFSWGEGQVLNVFGDCESQWMHFSQHFLPLPLFLPLAVRCSSLLSTW